MLENFTLETFDPLISSTFVLSIAERGLTAELELIQARSLGSNDAGGRDPFSIVFVHRSEEVLPQGTYPLEHDQLGAFELFIVPISQDDESVRYEAVFA
jgi:hypothetical protein